MHNSWKHDHFHGINILFCIEYTKHTNCYSFIDTVVDMSDIILASILMPFSYFLSRLYEQSCPSVSLSVFLPVTPLSQYSSHVSRVIPLKKVISMQKVKVRGQQSRSQRTKLILPQFGCFWTETPVSILIVFQGILSNPNVVWDKQSLM